MHFRLLAAVVVALLAPVASAGAATSDTCKVKGGSLVARQGALRVLAKGGDYLACYGRGKPLFVFDGASNEHALGLRLAGGRYLSLVDRRIAPVDGIPDVALEVYDVKVREHRRTALAEGVGGSQTDADALGPVQLALTPRGVAAVVNADELLVSDVSKATPVVVARGRGITELAASTSTIYWTQGGAVHSTLAGAPVAAPSPAGSTGPSGATGATGATSTA